MLQEGVKAPGFKLVDEAGKSLDLGKFKGKPIYIRFELRNMGLFAFQTPLEKKTPGAIESAKDRLW